MSLVTNISTYDHFLTKKLTRTQLAMFRETCFGPLLETNIMFYRPLTQYILHREVNESTMHVIRLNLLGQKCHLVRASITSLLDLDLYMEGALFVVLYLELSI